MHYIKLIIVAIMLIAAIINAIIEIRLARLASLFDISERIIARPESL